MFSKQYNKDVDIDAIYIYIGCAGRRYIVLPFGYISRPLIYIPYNRTRIKRQTKMLNSRSTGSE